MGFTFKTQSLAQTFAAARKLVLLETFVLAERDDGVIAVARLARSNSKNLMIGYRLPYGKLSHWMETKVLPSDRPDALQYWVKMAFFWADGHLAVSQ